MDRRQFLHAAALPLAATAIRAADKPGAALPEPTPARLPEPARRLWRRG
jgi:hypothetical protein